jgi:hypothetical protein
VTVNRRQLALAAIFVAPPAVLVALAAAVSAHYRIPPPDRLGPEARAAATGALRAALGGEPTRPVHPELERRLAGEGPVVVTVWSRGTELARVTGTGERIADAVASAGSTLAAASNRRLGASRLEQARIQVDVVRGRAPLAADLPGLRLFALHPGIDGLGVAVAGETHLLLPGELVRERLLNSEQPVRPIPEFRLGLNLKSADRVLARRAKVKPASWQLFERRYFRFRTDSFVEAPAASRERRPPLALTRGIPPGPALSAEALEAGALAGARYLVEHLADNGRYIYERHLATGRGTDPKRPRPYSLPRHAGTTYFLAEAYRITGEEWLREPIERAFRQMVELVDQGGCTGRTGDGAEFGCVHQLEDRFAGLGSTALAVVALCEYRRATGDGRYDQLTRRLAEWILMMQRPDGSFRHRYDVKAAEPDEKAHLLYFAGEAALALARMHAVYGDQRYRVATERALDDLVGFYDFFAGGFFYGEEHWTCIAAEAAWPALRHARYREFCDGYAEFLRRQQVRAGDWDEFDDLAGTYGVTPFIVPNNTPVGSRSEAMISSYLLGGYHGRRSEPLRRQILRSMEYALRHQIRDDSAFWVSQKAHGLGAFTASPLDPMVRIDYVQHIGSAMIRSLPLLDEGGE